MGHSQVYKLIKSIYNHGIKKTQQSEQSLVNTLLSFLYCRDSHSKCIHNEKNDNTFLLLLLLLWSLRYRNPRPGGWVARNRLPWRKNWALLTAYHGGGLNRGTNKASDARLDVLWVLGKAAGRILRYSGMSPKCGLVQRTYLYGVLCPA